MQNISSWLLLDENYVQNLLLLTLPYLIPPNYCNQRHSSFRLILSGMSLCGSIPTVLKGKRRLLIEPVDGISKLKLLFHLQQTVGSLRLQVPAFFRTCALRLLSCDRLQLL